MSTNLSENHLVLVLFSLNAPYAPIPTTPEAKVRPTAAIGAMVHSPRLLLLDLFGTTAVPPLLLSVAIIAKLLTPTRPLHTGGKASLFTGNLKTDILLIFFGLPMYPRNPVRHTRVHSLTGPQTSDLRRVLLPVSSSVSFVVFLVLFCNTAVHGTANHMVSRD